MVEPDSTISPEILQSFVACLKVTNDHGLVFVGRSGQTAEQIKALIDSRLVVRRKYKDNSERTYIPKVAKMRKKYLDD